MLYLIRVSGSDLYKVGCTSGPVENKLKELQAGSKHKLELLLSCKTPPSYERQVIQTMKDVGVNPTPEWLKMTPHQATAIFLSLADKV